MNLRLTILKLFNKKRPDNTTIIPDWIKSKYGNRQKQAFVCIYRGRNKLTMKQQWDMLKKEENLLNERKTGKQLKLDI